MSSVIRCDRCKNIVVDKASDIRRTVKLDSFAAPLVSNFDLCERCDKQLTNWLTFGVGFPEVKNGD